MKKLFALFMALLLLAGCGQRQEDQSSAPEEPNLSSTPDQTLDCRILFCMDDSLLLTQIVDGEETGDLIVLPHQGLGMEDQQHQAMQSDQLQPGMQVQITFDGCFLETYPCQLSGAHALRVTGDSQTLLPFYLEQVAELYQTDEGLNGDIQKIALDLSGLGNLSRQEKEALRYLVECTYQKETFFSSYQELCDQGIIDPQNPRYKDGIILTISSKEESDESFRFSAMKWRSGLGAVGYQDAQAKMQNGKWKCEIENWFIS